MNSRCIDGLRTRFPDTPIARPLITEFLDRVAVTLTAAVRPG
ncbi:hypothetical protein AB0M12_23165 [Nocardia vinacea]